MYVHVYVCTCVCMTNCLPCNNSKISFSKETLLTIEQSPDKNRRESRRNVT